jgi:hypothetical protein
LPAEQQEAIRTLSEAGGDFSYDGDPLRPELLRFYPHTSGTLRVMPLVCRLPSLRWIFLSAQNVTDEDLAELRGRKGLKRLVLYRTHVTDAGLVHLVGLTDLEELSFSYLPITDQGLEHLTGLRNLKVLWLQNTQVTPAGIERLKAALPNLEIKR